MGTQRGHPELEWVRGSSTAAPEGAEQREVLGVGPSGVTRDSPGGSYAVLLGLGMPFLGAVQGWMHPVVRRRRFWGASALPGGCLGWMHPG